MDPQVCYHEAVEVLNKIAEYKVNSPLAYIKTSLHNFLNEKAEEISKKVKKERRRPC